MDYLPSCWEKTRRHLCKRKDAVLNDSWRSFEHNLASHLTASDVSPTPSLPISLSLSLSLTLSLSLSLLPAALADSTPFSWPGQSASAVEHVSGHVELPSGCAVASADTASRSDPHTEKPSPNTNTHLLRHTNTHTTQTKHTYIPSASPLSRDTAAVIVEVVEEGLVMWEGLSK